MMYKSRQEKGIIFELSGYKLAKIVLSLPTFALISCVLLSVINDFEASTHTHCKVRNYLPSVSSSIGGFTPQRYIWRICIALHCAPRFMLAVMHWNYYNSFTPPKSSTLYQRLVPILGLLHIAENACLVTLSFISSTENYKIHENSFIGFMIFSELYMILTLILFKWSRAGAPMDARDQRSYRWKLSLFILNIGAFAVAGYFFIRHNTYCEPGIYTLFALCEYTVVLSNIAFHGTAVIEFGEGQLSYSELPVKPVRKEI